MEKRCLKCGKMIEVPEGEVAVQVTCPHCGCEFKLIHGTLIREKENYFDLGMPEENIEKRKYAPINGNYNGEVVNTNPAQRQQKKGLFATIKRMFGF